MQRRRPRKDWMRREDDDGNDMGQDEQRLDEDWMRKEEDGTDMGAKKKKTERRFDGEGR